MPTFGMSMRSNGENQYTIDGIGVTEETYKQACKAHGVPDMIPRNPEPALNPVETRTRYILDVRDGIDFESAAIMVQSVIRGGLISESAGIKQYSFVTIFGKSPEILVLANRRKTEQSAHSFCIWKNPSPTGE